MLGTLGPETLMIVLVVALVVLGPKKLPELGKTVGRALSEFRRVQADVRREISEGMTEQPPALGSPGTNGGGAPGSSSIGSEASSGGASPMAPHPPAPGGSPPPSEPPGTA